MSTRTATSLELGSDVVVAHGDGAFQPGRVVDVDESGIVVNVGPSAEVTIGPVVVRVPRSPVTVTGVAMQSRAGIVVVSPDVQVDVQDRRSSERVPASSMLRISLLPSGAEFGAWTVDLSQGGLKARLRPGVDATELRAGAAVRLRLGLDGTEFEIGARVIDHAEEIVRFEFERLPAATFDGIATFLAQRSTRRARRPEAHLEESLRSDGVAAVVIRGDHSERAEITGRAGDTAVLHLHEPAQVGDRMKIIGRIPGSRSMVHFDAVVRRVVDVVDGSGQVVDVHWTPVDDTTPDLVATWLASTV